MGQSPAGSSYGDIGMEFHQGKSYFGIKYLMESPIKTILPIKITDCNSIIMSVRAPVGDINLTNKSVCIGRGLCSIKYLVENSQEYLYNFLLAMKKYYIDNSTGTTFKAVTADTVSNTPVCLPPLREQHRIINKIKLLYEIIN